MNPGLIDFLYMLGALGVFLFGMKLMSESIQKVARNKMHTILESMNSSTFWGVLTGMFITALIQSSSATTVMVVSFVNAGLMALQQSVAVIMGANIGTTVTTWMISILGFSASTGVFAYPLVGVSLPFLFSKKRSRKSWAELILGFALLFIGFGVLRDVMPRLMQDEALLELFSSLSEYGFGSSIIFVLLGIFFTILLKSSSATMALTLIMGYMGWIPFEEAVAVVLGLNIGTTITANFAARVANIPAKRAAAVHLIFNVVGVLLALILFKPSMQLLETFMMKIGYQSPLQITSGSIEQTRKAIPVALAAYHTFFNVINTLLLIWFANQISRFATHLVRNKQGGSENFHLQHIKTGMLSTPEASIYQAKLEVLEFAERSIKMFSKIKQLYFLRDDKYFDRLLEKINRNEEICDRLEIEIAKYLTKIGESRLSENASQEVSSMYKQIDNLESIGDACTNLARSITRKRENKVTFSPEIDNNLKIMFGLVDDSLHLMKINLGGEGAVSIDNSLGKEQEINNYRDILKEGHLINIDRGLYSYQTGIIYNDIFSECEKIGDYSINISQAVGSVE